jgi:hypothetical protein
MAINELSVAQAVAEGVLPSPTVWGNSFFINLRLSGVGCAWRNSVNEYVVRDRHDWCSAAMLDRFRGCLCVWGHPATGTLTSQSFGDTCVGVILWTYVHPELDEPWGTARLLDANCARLIAEGKCDTSPGITIDPSQCSQTIVDGKKLLCEGIPASIDHLAIVYMGEDPDNPENKGVWSRSPDGPDGVELTEQP